MTHGKLRGLLVFLPLLGCGHTEPFGSAPTGTEQPFDVGPPARLTLNQGPDRSAAWLPDGSGMIYSTQQLGRPDRDVCLAVLPAGGGQQRRLTCGLSAENIGLTDAMESPAPQVDGLLAYVAARSSIGAINPDQESIVLSTVDDPAGYTILRSIPYSLAGQGVHTGISQLQWLNPNRILFLGERVRYTPACPEAGCPLDTVRTGLDAVWLALDEVNPSPQRIPGTQLASGVSTGGDENEVYYTLAGDTRVFRQNLSDGVVSVIHDFGAAGVARDVQVRGNRLAAIVGGRVTFGMDPIAGPTQWDSGGVLHVVDLQTGIGQALDGPGLFRRPRISPSESAIVAEGYPLIITDILDAGGDVVAQDTLISKGSDLYLFGQP